MKTFDSKFWLIFIPFLMLIILILFFPYWFTTRSFFKIDFSNSGPIGDTIGGIMGPFIGIAAAILTFFAFWVQYKANEQQKQDLKIERFENKFYNMLEINRQNVSEITIGKNVAGRKAFISMFDELKYLYLLTKYFLSSPEQRQLILNITGKDSLNDDEIFNIVYLIFYYGIGQNSNKIILELFSNRYLGILINLKEYLEKYQNLWDKGEILTIDEVTVEGDMQFVLIIDYRPFSGHMSYVSHYIRHLHSLIKYIDEQPDKFLSQKSKYEYVVTIRVQLSIYEQLFIYYNSLSILGESMFKKGYLEKYCLVKNIPIQLADFYKKPEEILPPENKQGKTMFEWITLLKRWKVKRINDQILFNQS